MYHVIGNLSNIDFDGYSPQSDSHIHTEQEVLTKTQTGNIIRYTTHITSSDVLMDSKYKIGQKVLIKSVSNQAPSLRDCTIDPYVGQIGQVTDYYWISPITGKVFYIYTVRVGAKNKEIVLHEDELETYID